MAVVDLVIIFDGFRVQGDDDGRVLIELAYFRHCPPGVSSGEHKDHHVIHVEIGNEFRIQFH